MKHDATARQIDNRNSDEMCDYMEARIEALKKRLRELQAENEVLRWRQQGVEIIECDVDHIASA